MTVTAKTWRRRFAVALGAAVALTCTPGVPVGAEQRTRADEPAAEDLARWVNPYIGTKKGTATGLTHPGAVAPFGMVQWGPDTVLPQVGGYNYNDNRIKGFSLTHLSGAGCSVYQDVPFMPVTSEVTTSPASDPGRYTATFDRANERTSPGHYGVRLGSGVDVRLTATQRTGAARLAFPALAPASLLVNTGGSVNGVTDAEVTIGADSISGRAASGMFCGYPHGYTVYFHAQFDRPFRSVGTWQGDAVTPGQRTASGQRSGGFVTFAPGEIVTVKVGLSYVSVDGARGNLSKESGTTSFDGLATAARATWNERLNRVKTRGGTDGERTTFYTALYHSLLHPNVFSDVDGAYPGFDQKIHVAEPGHAQYTNISGWDVYRSEIQLLALIAPAETSDIVRSMVSFAEQAGHWDRWTIANGSTAVMNGDPYHVMVAASYAFGARDFDARKALSLMVRGATQPSQERPGLPEYLRYGYVSTGAPGVWGPAATTLEYTAADFAIADLARRLGDTATWTTFSKRSQNWQNVFNPATGHLQMRNADGSFRQPFDPVDGEGWVEGNATQYSWMVPFNQRGLIDAMGGNAAVTPRLDAFFEKLNVGAEAPFAWLGNEPSMHTPWLYNYTGTPARTQLTVRRAMTELFTPHPDGLAGNDDLGQMSSWYVWAAMGMYPVTPGRAELVVNGPLFTGVWITRPSGQKITILAPEASATTPFVLATKVNGLVSTRTYLPESLVTNGGTVEYRMASVGGGSWGRAPEDAPPSFREGEAAVSGYVRPGRVTVAPGSSGTAEVGARASTGFAGPVQWWATPPPGITVEPSSGALSPSASGPGQQVTVRVAGTVRPTAYRIPVSYTAGGVSLPGNAIQVLVGERGGLREAFSNVAASPDDNQSVASFDPLWNYSTNALAAAGVTPGAPIVVDGLTHHWPAVEVGEPDNVVSRGQTIAVTAQNATRLSLLGSATNGNASGMLTITYTDGTTQRAEVGLSDWTLSGGLAYGNKVAVRTPYRNSVYGFTVPVPVHVFATAPIALTPGKQISTVRLPSDVSGGELHVFGVTVV